MVSGAIVRRGTYRDSIELLRVTLDIEALAGVRRASAMMGTPGNLRLIEEAGLPLGEGAQAGPNDLVIAVEATSDESLAAAFDQIETLLRPIELRSVAAADRAPRSVVHAFDRQSDADLLLVSTPGAYAAAEALKGLKRGLNVFIFSDNVPLEQEVAIKRYAEQHELLVMGPDCGTALLGGAPLGFANLVRAGGVGLVGPSGTGMQEVACLLDRLGAGVSHAVGTGSHDLSDEVGGSSASRAIHLLDADPATNAIAVIAKPSSVGVAQRIVDIGESVAKPVVACFLGLALEELVTRTVVLTRTLEETARAVVEMTGQLVPPDRTVAMPEGALSGRIRGLYSGGTLCAEAAMILADAGLAVASNVAMPGVGPLEHEGAIHRCVDLGADEYTLGRPHPMIDLRSRLDMISEAARDPDTVIVLLDIVLGVGSHPDPAGELTPTIRGARDSAGAAGRELRVIASVCGTEADPQVLSRQVRLLREAGVEVMPSNAAAARRAALLVGGAIQPCHASGRVLTPAEAANSISRPQSSRWLQRPAHVISVGVGAFDGALMNYGVGVTRVEWRPPGSGDPGLSWALAQLSDDFASGPSSGGDIHAANQKAVGRLLDARPTLVGLMRASDVWAGAGRRLLHAGPPIEWSRMCGPMRGALIGATLFEGWADTSAQAEILLAGGDIALEPCHHSGAVGPMAGVISPSMSVWVVRDATSGRLAYSNLNEGLGPVLRFGAFGPEVIDRLRWMEAVLAPTLRSALSVEAEGVDLKTILAQALQMGDDGHNRNVAATSLMFRILAPRLLASDCDRHDVEATLRFIDANNHFFLNLSMAAAKVALDAAHGVPGSSLVTAMARNGVEFGIRVSGLGDRWFTAPADVPDGLFFPGYSAAEANPDMGDSAITETAGVGGFAMGTAPALVQFVGGTAEDALGYTREMMEITLARNSAYSLPPLGFTGTPTGIDLRRVVDTGILPVINSGIAHREAGVGQIGAGIVRAPMGCFESALLALASEFKVKALLT